MFAFITFGHAFLAVAVAALIGGALGYAYRGKEHQYLGEAGQIVDKVKKDLP